MALRDRFQLPGQPHSVFGGFLSPFSENEVGYVRSLPWLNRIPRAGPSHEEGGGVPKLGRGLGAAQAQGPRRTGVGVYYYYHLSIYLSIKALQRITHHNSSL